MEKIKEMINSPDIEDDTIGDHLIVNRSDDYLEKIIKSIMLDMDANNDGHISFDEFK